MKIDNLVLILTLLVSIFAYFQCTFFREKVSTCIQMGGEPEKCELLIARGAFYGGYTRP